MEIITTPFNYDDAIELVKNNVDIILLTDSRFGVRNVFDCNYELLLKILDYRNSINSNTKIWVNVNAFFFEQDILELEKYLIQLDSLSNEIEKIVFNDFSICQICYEQNLKLNLHYDPNTLVTSYGQFELYKNNNINSVSLSNELFLPEIITILKNKPENFKIAIQCHGHVFIMHSRWNLISNFKNYVEDITDEYVKNKVYYIKELDRKFSNIIYEDKHGSHMLSGYELCIIKELKQLYDNGLDYIKIDNIFQSNKYSLEIYKVYKEILNSFKLNKYNDINFDKLYEQLKKIGNSKILSAGFVGGIDGVLNYEKK